MTKIAISIQKLMLRIADYLKAILKILIQSKWSIKYPKTEVNSLTILGNGPSLLDDLERVKRRAPNTDYMAVNFFVTSPLFSELKPSRFVLCDPLFFNVTKDNENYDRITDFYKALFQDCTWEMVLFIPTNMKKKYLDWLKKLGLSNDLISLHVYNKTNMNGDSGLIHHFYKKGLGMPRPTTVLIPCLMIGIGMGYKEIGLTGAGHNYHEGIAVSEENVLMLKLPHFYESKEEIVYKPYKKPDNAGTYTMSELFLALHKMFGSYGFVSSFAKKMKVKLLNYTMDSYIDQIEKVKE